MALNYIRPCKTKNISDDFSDHVKRHSNLPGVDYTCKIGDSVYATADGMVLAVSHTANSAGGIMITIRHRDGRKSYYLHLSRILVGVGKRVKAGHLIARSGNTGRSTGPHLHFAIRDKSGKCVDPEKVIKADPKPKVANPTPPKGKGPAVKKVAVAEVIPE
jgi:murein DD-endopeptidase MepM/ murein hydrolase activator NlpD